LNKTTNEVLFLPLPRELKLKAKSFVDVTADRFIGKGIGGAILLLVIKVFGFSWVQISYLSLGYCIIWAFMARRARKEYMAVFRKSIETHDLTPVEMKRETGDPATIETLIEELGSLDAKRVLYGIDLLDSLEKQNLITPLLLHHESPEVRARALKAIQSVRPDLVERWLPSIERSLKDESSDVRAAAVVAMAELRKEQATELMRPYLSDPDPRMVAAAAVALAGSPNEDDLEAAEDAISRLSADGRESASQARREAARALSQAQEPRFRYLLVPLIYDQNIDVAGEAIAAAQKLGSSDNIFVPALVSLLRHRQHKNAARQVLVSYGEDILDALAHFLHDPQEDTWVRRHIPGTIALIPCQKSVDILTTALKDEDGFLRYKALAALEKLHRKNPELSMDRAVIEELTGKEALRYFRSLGLHYNLFVKGELSKDSLLAQAFEEKRTRTWDRLFRAAGLIWPWKDTMAARWAIEHGDKQARSSAIEYMDNMMTGQARNRIMPIIEDMPVEDKVHRGNVMLKTRVRDVEETLARLIYDEDPVVAALAIDMVRDLKLWDLADDLEQALAFRDAKDFAVFEAASHALAEYRLGKEINHAV
jgi:AAA family ATP:ADP antiporter